MIRVRISRDDKRRDARIRGGEVQLHPARPTGSVRGLGDYTHARLGRPPAGASIGNEGDPLQNAPEWQGTVSGELSFRCYTVTIGAPCGLMLPITAGRSAIKPWRATRSSTYRHMRWSI